MRLHLLAPFNTVPAQRFSSCAFAGLSLRFAKMMRPFGYHVIEYSNEGSESEADEHVVIFRETTRAMYFPDAQPYAMSPGAVRYDRNLSAELDERLKPGDIVVHVFGATHAHLISEYPQAHHVEASVGYMDKPFGAFRIYESDQWRHYHWGLADGAGIAHQEASDRSRSAVIPIAFDADEWPIGDGAGDTHGPYVLFMGRLVQQKGTEVVSALADRGVRFKVAGAGDIDGWSRTFTDRARANVEFLGTIKGRDRAPLVGSASCVLMPTQGIEPLGAIGIEGMLCGTPLVASDWGGFGSTVEPGVTGFRCRTVDDFGDAVVSARTLDRAAIAASARRRYSLAAIGPQYDRVFRSLLAVPANQ